MTSQRRRLPAILLIAIAAGCGEAEPTNVLRVSGHVEATEVQVAPEVGGRILEMLVDEGDRVTAGDTLARVDTRDTELQIQRARAERAAADAQWRLLRAGSRDEDIRRAEAQVQAARADVTAIDAEIASA
jgi:HlyD family secretion protein